MSSPEPKWLVGFYLARYRCSQAGSPYFKKGIKFLMTKDDFKYLWFRDKAFKMKKPSIDRIDSSGNYELKNCQYIEHSENASKAYRTKLPVNQIDLNGKLVKSHESVRSAMRFMGITHHGIYNCLINKAKTCGGYLWKKKK